MIPAFLIARFGKTGAKAAMIGTIALLVILILSVAYCTGRGDGKRGEIVKAQERQIETLEDLAAARDNASEARVMGEVRIALQQKELKDALETTNDPDRQRALRGCIILQQQGRDTTSFPACTRSVGDD